MGVINEILLNNYFHVLGDCDHFERPFISSKLIIFAEWPEYVSHFVVLFKLSSLINNILS